MADLLQMSISVLKQNLATHLFLSMTGGGVEWLELKDKDFSYSRPNMICNFLYEKEEEMAESQDKLAEESEGEASDKGNFDENFEPEMKPSAEIDDSAQILDNTSPEAVESPSLNAP